MEWKRARRGSGRSGGGKPCEIEASKGSGEHGVLDPRGLPGERGPAGVGATADTGSTAGAVFAADKGVEEELFGKVGHGPRLSSREERGERALAAVGRAASWTAGSKSGRAASGAQQRLGKELEASTPFCAGAETSTAAARLWAAARCRAAAGAGGAGVSGIARCECSRASSGMLMRRNAAGRQGRCYAAIRVRVSSHRTSSLVPVLLESIAMSSWQR